MGWNLKDSRTSLLPNISFLSWAKWLHSTKMWRTVTVHWQCSHRGGRSFLKMYEWVKCVWPMRAQHTETHIHIFIHTYMCEWMCAYRCVHAFMCVCVWVNVCMHSCVCSTYLCIRMHTWVWPVFPCPHSGWWRARLRSEWRALKYK